MKDAIICKKCGGTNFELIGTSRIGELYIYCPKCMIFYAENLLISSPKYAIQERLFD